MTAKVIRGVCDGDRGEMSKASEPYFVGVDVGTGSARAALVASDGRVLEQAVQEIKTWTPEPHYYEQSSEDIWGAICHVVKVSLLVEIKEFLDLFKH